MPLSVFFSYKSTSVCISASQSQTSAPPLLKTSPPLHVASSYLLESLSSSKMRITSISQSRAAANYITICHVICGFSTPMRPTLSPLRLSPSFQKSRILTEGGVLPSGREQERKQSPSLLLSGHELF
ncbi:hypothetical protein AMECASPLE_022509 [Ameca splendens]|uniref:Uncharacterized protein n=1 Tax=Ameca splendens TaxID=208324 RepID=A0ABV0ZRE2_9TELE